MIPEDEPEEDERKLVDEEIILGDYLLLEKVEKRYEKKYEGYLL